MQGEQTFRREPPDLTVGQMTVMVVLLSFVAGIAGWLLIDCPALPAMIIHFGSIWYLRRKKQATERAIIISCEPVAAVGSFFVALGEVISLHGIPIHPHTDRILVGLITSALATTTFLVEVNRLDKKWRTLVRHIYV